MGGVNDEQEPEPHGGRGKGPRKREERGWHRSPRQKPSRGRRGGGGGSHDDIPGIEISIAGGVAEMVRVLTTVTESSYIDSLHQQP